MVVWVCSTLFLTRRYFGFSNVLPFHLPLLRFSNKKLTFFSFLRLQSGRLVLSSVSKILRSKSCPRSWSRKSRGRKSRPWPPSQKITGGKPRPRHRSRKIFGESLNPRLDLEVVTMSGLVLGLGLEKVILADLWTVVWVCSTLFVSPESRINLGENGSMSLLYYRAESI